MRRGKGGEMEKFGLWDAIALELFVKMDAPMDGRQVADDACPIEVVPVGASEIQAAKRIWRID